MRTCANNAICFSTIWIKPFPAIQVTNASWFSPTFAGLITSSRTFHFTHLMKAVVRYVFSHFPKFSYQLRMLKRTSKILVVRCKNVWPACNNNLPARECEDWRRVPDLFANVLLLSAQRDWNTGRTHMRSDQKIKFVAKPFCQILPFKIFMFW